jgi:hypothetical protein
MNRSGGQIPFTRPSQRNFTETKTPYAPSAPNPPNPCRIITANPDAGSGPNCKPTNGRRSLKTEYPATPNRDPGPPTPVVSPRPVCTAKPRLASFCKTTFQAQTLSRRPRRLLIMVELHRNQLRNPRLLHRDPIHRLRRFHRLLRMRNHNKLRIDRHLCQKPR